MCAHYSHQLGKKIISYLNTHSNTYVCFMEMKHTLLQNIYICRIFFPLGYIVGHVHTFLLKGSNNTSIHFQVPTYRRLKFNIPLGGKCNCILTWSCHILHGHKSSLVLTIITRDIHCLCILRAFIN